MGYRSSGIPLSLPVREHSADGGLPFELCAGAGRRLLAEQPKGMNAIQLAEIFQPQNLRNSLA